MASPDPNPCSWPSLAGQLAVADTMFGDEGAALVEAWLLDEIGHVGDPAFAKLFTDYSSLPGVAANDYTHRYVRSRAGELVGGIRFYGQDTSRPFVEVIAHSFDNLRGLAACVLSEWSAFGAKELRMRTRPGELTRPDAGIDAKVDVTIHASRHRDMAPPDGRVRLEMFEHVEDAIAMVRQRYERVAAVDPDLARNVSAADPDDLRSWHTQNQLRAIQAIGNGSSAGDTDRTVGLLAVAPGRVAWIEGDEVNEICIATEHNGHGYGSSAQREWAAGIASERDRNMVGTIDRLNHASRCSAERARRPAVLEEVFVAL